MVKIGHILHKYWGFLQRYKFTNKCGIKKTNQSCSNTLPFFFFKIQKLETTWKSQESNYVSTNSQQYSVFRIFLKHPILLTLKTVSKRLKTSSFWGGGEMNCDLFRHAHSSLEKKLCFFKICHKFIVQIQTEKRDSYTQNEKINKIDNSTTVEITAGMV